MNFSNYYNLQEVASVRKNAGYRFLAHSDDSRDWYSKITSIIEASSISGIDKPLLFPITDPTGNFVLNLESESNHKYFSYNVREEFVPWLQEHKLTNRDDNPGFYYDVQENSFVIQQKDKEFVIENKFSVNSLEKFLDEIFYINKLCKNGEGYKFALVYSLYFFDNFNVNEAEKIRNNSMAPRWFISSLKRDETRKSGGFFSNIFRN